MTDQKKLKVRVSPDRAEAKYSDFAIVTKNALGFNFDFAQRVPGDNQINIVSRIGMSPQHAKLLANILKKHIDEYEEKFGKIEIPQATKKVKNNGVIHFVK